MGVVQAMRFYVYITKKDEKATNYAFVDNIPLFVQNDYDPNTMTFTGIAIEANSSAEAWNIYNNPTSEVGEYILVDEPAETVATRALSDSKQEVQSMTDKLARQIDVMRYTLMMKLVAAKLVETNKIMNEIAIGIHAAYGSPSHVTPQAVFDSLSEYVLKHTIKFDNGQSKQT
jgi:hypothetical protein